MTKGPLERIMDVQRFLWPLSMEIQKHHNTSTPPMQSTMLATRWLSDELKNSVALLEIEGLPVKK